MKFGAVIGVCTDRGEDQRRAIQSIANYSDRNTDLVCIFNGVDPFPIDRRFTVMNFSELIGKERGLWEEAFKIAVANKWTWCANFHDDFYLCEEGWEAWLQQINRTHYIAIASFASYNTITPGNPPAFDDQYSYASGNNDVNSFLAVTVDGCGMAFNMDLFRQR